MFAMIADMRDYSTTSRRGMNATSGFAPLLCLEISHADLSSPIRVVHDNQDVTHGGNTFVAIDFSIDLPDDQDRQIPSAQVGIDNVGRELTKWLEASNGGEGATCRILQLQRVDPEVVEWECILDFKNVKMDLRRVTSQLGFEDLLSSPGVLLTYRPETAPGSF